MALLKRRRVLAAKIEATSGTAETLANADASFNVFNPQIKPSIEFHKREARGGFGDLPGVTGSRSGTATFSIELTGGATVPAWAATFLPACGWVDNAGTFSPKTETPGDNVKTLTIGCYEDGKLKKIRGASGTFKIMGETGKRVMVEFTFTGVWVDESDDAILSPSYPSNRGIRFMDAEIDFDGWSPKVSKLDFDAGNNVELREDATDDAGYCNAIITNRNVVGSFDPESSLVATNPVYSNWQSGDTKEVTVTLKEAVANQQVVLFAPTVQYSDVQPGSRGDRNTDDINFQCCRDGGDNQLSITFSDIPAGP